MPDGYGHDLFVGSLDDAIARYLPKSGIKRDDAAPRSMDDPIMWGRGPALFSTCVTLALSPEVCWDCNRWYETLGVPWRATKADLREAFLAIGPMPSPWQMHCLRSLLNPVIRFEYDRLPLGDIYLDDYAKDMIRAAAAERLLKAHQQGNAEANLESMLDEMGMRIIPPEEPDEMVDSEASEDDDDASATVDPGFLWSYYIWKTHKIDVSRIEQWQAFIVAAFAARGERLKLAVGLHGAGPHPWLVAEVGSKTVVFIRDDQQPNAEAAADAAERVISDRGTAETREAIAS